MTPLEEQRLEEMFQAGDPAARLDPYLTTRVAARLKEPRGARQGWARWALVGMTLVSSAGLGAAAVWVTNEVRRPAPVVEPAKPSPRATPALPAAHVADPLAEEAALVQASLEALQRGDAELALSTLGERQQRFPHGLLASEAAVARLKALLLARRDDEALSGFAALQPTDLTVPLRLTWADLLVKHGRCAEALRVLAPVEDQAVAKALKGSCSSRPQ